MEFFDKKIRDYISSNLDLDSNFEFEQFKVGRSNITFKIFDNSISYVLRRPPFGNKLESAHNMQREFRIITELSRNNLKVPKPILLCIDRAISEDDFYIMEYIEGETIADNLVAAKYSVSQKKKITESFVTSLAELHSFDVTQSNLKDLGKHQDYVERQLNRWNKQFKAQKVREIDDLDKATKLLFDNIPSQQKVSIVHGDYRLDNVRINKNSVAAIVDWELCTLGDPLADLGTVIASWSDENEIDTPFIYSPSLSGGFPSRKEIINLYEKNSLLNIGEIEFYVRLSFWKHAMIMEGVYVRYSLGYYGNVDKKDIEAFGQSTLNFAKKASTKKSIEGDILNVIPADELENHIGEEIGVSEWIEITQERINQFADATNDHQFIHVDPEAAKAAPTPWDTTIAHGFLTLSLVSYMSVTSGFMPAQMQTAVNYGSDKVRFMEAVPVDSKIRGKFVLTEAQYKKNGRWLVKTTVTIEIEGVEKPAAIVETLTLYIVKE